MAEDEFESPVWHSLTAGEALERVGANAQGLSGEEAARRSDQQGLNRITPADKRSAWRRFLGQFANALIAVLLGAMAVMAALGDWPDAAVVGAVVLINALIGFIQEGRSERALEQVRKAVAHRVTVLRDGRTESVDAERVVVGDIVVIKSGDLVPADLRFIEAKGLVGVSIAFDRPAPDIMRRPPRARSAAPVGLFLVWRIALNALFGSAPIGPIDWALAGLLGLALFAAIEVEKWIGRSWRDRGKTV